MRKKTVICATRYGNVMASRGSVIPLFVGQIRTGHAITVTDPHMTRFLMSLDEAVELVLYAFKNAKPGDIFVQKAPACTVEILAMAVRELFEAQTDIKIIGTRHGEKLYETLLTREEMAVAQDLPGYFRIVPDNRDLNYEKYFSEGEELPTEGADYNSHNTERLGLEQVKAKLLTLQYVQDELKENLKKQMKKCLITGANGFVGRNLCANLEVRDDCEILKYDIGNTRDELREFLTRADFIFHLAGVNRPKDESEFKEGNADLTQDIVDILGELGKSTPILLSSSTQAELANPYGQSKKMAEDVVLAYGNSYVYRFPNLFGKWCRPNYNSVVATFCHNIAHDLPIQINNEAHLMTLCYIDDVVRECIKSP